MQKSLRYRPRKDLVRFAKEYHTLSPSKLRDIILVKRNKEVTPESITMWFKRHPDHYEELHKDIHAEQLPNLEVNETTFENGTFEELPTVKQWITEMKRRDIVQWKDMVGVLKRVCRGKFPNWQIDLVEEGKWCLKHPDRLTLPEVIHMLDILKAKGIDTPIIRIPIRNFLQSRGITIGKKISGAKSRNFGKFADLYVEKEKLNQMLEWVKKLNYEAYAVDMFMFKTGTRITGTLNARIEDIRAEEDYAEITVYDKGRRSIHAEGKKWKKHLPQDLWEIMKDIIGNRKIGKIFTITNREMSAINRRALKEIVPDVEKNIPMPNHFWRHMFFQHMLRATKWNYGAVAALGGSTVASLEESYGKPPRAVIRKWGLNYLPAI